LKVWLDGALVEQEAARISAQDHGFLVGDGVFETLRVYAGALCGLDEHLERLRESALVMAIELGEMDLHQAARDVVQVNELGDARMRITVTSGSGPPGLGRGSGPPTVLVTALSLTPWPATATAIVSSVRRDQDSPLSGVKTTSLAASVVALSEARTAGADEALLLNLAGDLCEATTANVFCVLDGEPVTPPVESGCLAGITRDHVLTMGGAERRLSIDDLRGAGEAFLTSSTREVQPLVAVDGRSVGDGKPGPVTRRIAAEYSAMVSAALG
jgi:branched-chain amino acid aminotransferase